MVTVDGLPESFLVKPQTHHIVEVHNVHILVSFHVQDIVHSDPHFLPTAQVFPQRLNPQKAAGPGVKTLNGDRCIRVGRLYPAFKVALITVLINCLIRRGKERQAKVSLWYREVWCCHQKG